MKLTEETPRNVATTLWPAQAELLSSSDWNTLDGMLASNIPPDEGLLDPIGEAKDAFLAALMILYWTMRVVKLAIEISKEVADLKGRARVEAIANAVTNRLDERTPQQVRDRVSAIAEAIEA